MAPPSIPDAVLQNTVDIYLKHDRNQVRTAVALNCSRAKVQDHIRQAIGRGLISNEPEPLIEVVAPQKPRFRVKAVTHETPPEGPIYRVIAIGDLHDAPKIPKERLNWIGKYVRETKPDRVVQIGDWGTFDSVSQHDAVGSLKWMEKPSFTQDLESLNESHAAYAEGKGDYECPHDVTYGNHEYRVNRAADADPKRFGDAVLRMDEVFARWGWKTHPYGEFMFIGGVGLTHIPINGAGKDYRGKRVENQIGNDAMFSVILGHTHKRGFWTFPKIGPQKRIDILNLGTAMPHGHCEEYAKMSTTGWTWGVYDLTIQGGLITSDKFISMLELKERYA
jgi:hypothetical protein